MKKNVIRLIILLFYCIPFAYLAMQGDANSGTLLFYGFMIVGFGILCRATIKTNNTRVLIIGNGLSFISSYIFTLNHLPVEWSWYFKPFTPTGLLVFISFLSFLIQLFILYKFNKRVASFH